MFSALHALYIILFAAYPITCSFFQSSVHSLGKMFKQLLLTFLTLSRNRMRTISIIWNPHLARRSCPSMSTISHTKSCIRYIQDVELISVLIFFFKFMRTAFYPDFISEYYNSTLGQNFSWSCIEIFIYVWFHEN